MVPQGLLEILMNTYGETRDDYGRLNCRDMGRLFFFYLFIYLFWLHWVLVVAHGIFVAVCRIFSCGMWDL